MFNFIQIEISIIFILLLRCSQAIDGDLRLQGGNNSYGRLMVSLKEEWTTICSDWWKPENSLVACEQLGFEMGGMRVLNDEIPVLSNDTRIGLDDVNCEECKKGECHTNSNVKKLIECRSSEYFDHDCTHKQDVFLSCNPSVHSGEIKLQGRRRFKKILYLHRSRWINVCGLSNWTQKNTNIVCNQLGYYCGKEKMFPLMGTRNQSMAMYDVQCFSLNSRFKDCQFSIPENIGQSLCVEADHLYVYCSSTCSKRLPLEMRNPTLFISSLFNLKPFNSTIELVSKHPFRFMLYPRLHNKSAFEGLEVEIILDPEECQGPQKPSKNFFFSSPFFVPITFWNCYRFYIRMNLLRETNYSMYFYEVKIKTVEEATYQFKEKPQNQAIVMGSKTKHQLNCSVYTSIPVQWVFEPIHQNAKVLFFNDQLNDDTSEYYEVQNVDEKSGSRNLIIKTVDPSVAGRYYCIESNGGGLNASADIIVLESETQCSSEQNMKIMTVNCRTRFNGNYAPVLNATEGFVKFQTFSSPIMLNYNISYILSENIPTSKYTFMTFFNKPKHNAPSYTDVSYLFFNGKDGDIHLVGGNSTYGRLLVNVNGEWVRVCADKWTIINTLFVCKQLGFSFGGKVVKERHLKEQISVGNEYKIGMFRVECGSNILPQTIIKCPYKIADQCEDRDDVFISCTPTHGEVKLLGTKQQYRRLLVSNKGKWSRICSKVWPEVNTRVACRKMKSFCGLQRYVMKAPKSYIPITIQNIDCESRPYSQNLLDCDHESFNGESCTFVNEIYLQCISECKSEVLVEFPKNPTINEDSSSLFYVFIPSYYNIKPFNYSKTFKFNKRTKFLLKPLVNFFSEPKNLIVEIILDGTYCKGPLLNANSSFYFSDLNFVPLILWNCLEFTIKFTSTEYSDNSVIEYAIFLNQTEAWENMKDEFVIAPKSVAVSKNDFVLECRTFSKKPVQWVFTPFQKNQSYSIFFNNQLNPSLKDYEVLTDNHGSYNLKYKGCNNMDKKEIAGNYKCILNNGGGIFSEAEVIFLETEIVCDPLSTDLYPDQELIVSCQVTFYGKFSPAIDVDPFLPGMQIMNASRPNRMFYIVRSPINTDMKKFTLTITTFFPQLNFYSPIYIQSSKINLNVYGCPTNCSVSYTLNKEDHTVLKCSSMGLAEIIYRWFEQIEETGYIDTEPFEKNLTHSNDKKSSDNPSSNNTKPNEIVQMRWVLVGKTDEIDVKKLVVKKKYKCLVLQKDYVRKSCSCEVDHIHASGDYLNKLYSPQSIQFYVPKSHKSKPLISVQQVNLPKNSRLTLSPQYELGTKYTDVTFEVEYEGSNCKGPFNNGKTSFKYEAYPFKSLMLWNCSAFKVIFNLSQPRFEQEYMRNITLKYLDDFRSTEIEISKSLAFGLSELSTIAFQCHIETDEDVQWLFKQAHSPLLNSIYFNGNLRENTSFHQVTLSDKLKMSMLRLGESSYKDINQVLGTYTCVGDNGSGKTASSELIFIEQPTRCFAPNSFLKKNETALINCMAFYRGNFSPIIMVESNLEEYELINQTDSTTMAYFIRFKAPKVSERITFAIKTYFKEPHWNPPDYHYLITFGFMVE